MQNSISNEPRAAQAFREPEERRTQVATLHPSLVVAARLQLVADKSRMVAPCAWQLGQ